jgi:uncharacterized protein YybS (DUF2232 family)
MKLTIHKVLTVVAAAFSVFVAFAVLRRTPIGTPGAMSFDAWPHWLIFMALVYTGNQFLQFWVDRLFGPRDPLMLGGSND